MEEEAYVSEETGREGNEQNHKWFVWVVLIFALVGGGILIFIILSGLQGKTGEKRDGVQPAVEMSAKQYNYTVPSDESCRKLESIDKVNLCLDEVVSAVAVDGKNFNKCSDIKDAAMRGDCQINVAQNLPDEKLCLLIEDKQIEERCLSGVSIAKKDPSVCKLQDKSAEYVVQECIDRTMSFIISEDGNKDNLGDCAKIETLEYGNLCLENSYKNKFNDDCTMVPDSYRNHCIAEKLINGVPKTEDCAKISLETAQKTINYKEFCIKVAQMGLEMASLVDSDNDGIADGNELFMNLDPHNPDVDGDGLTDGEEWVTYGTSPEDPDSDHDGLTDSQEVKVTNTDPDLAQTPAQVKALKAQFNLK